MSEGERTSEEGGGCQKVKGHQKRGRMSEGRRPSKSETPFGPLLRAYMVSAAKEA